jgi:phosphoglycerate dehydrogenase-like enzyme
VVNAYEAKPKARRFASCNAASVVSKRLITATGPNCLLTPHVAGRTDAETAARNVAENLTRHLQGKDLLWQVDREKGY